jgi:hypothetical protein
MGGRNYNDRIINFILFNMKKISKITVLSIFVTMGYLIALYVDYGMKSSISSYAQNVIMDGHEWMTLTWLVSLFVTTTYISVKQKKWWTMFLFLSGFILLPIAYFTGYYEGFMNHNGEDVVHVLSVYLSIPLAFTYIIIDAKKKGNGIVGVVLLGWFVAFWAMATALDISHHTYWIEVVALLCIYPYLIIKK